MFVLQAVLQSNKQKPRSLPVWAVTGQWSGVFSVTCPKFPAFCICINICMCTSGTSEQELSWTPGGIEEVRKKIKPQILEPGDQNNLVRERLRVIKCPDFLKSEQLFRSYQALWRREACGLTWSKADSLYLEGISGEVVGDACWRHWREPPRRRS